ncbi:hypothetical protein [Paenibacillus hexagrammi]|uniref:Uncharacterized protein n=1 Tax=Paenibacillus hexagrammi TaxID=2908839 RepID=A0ABY3SUA2_9BACL|nr:hypothetical protein [Paenibacillus sp. YPD9-1]UJF36556.1 hypothetical protein L0M14_30680 [Paenibacillus sp. YPD9-1]
MKTPRSFNVAVNLLKKDLSIQMGMPSIYEDEIREGSAKLREIRRMWRKFGEMPFFQRMSEIVDALVDHYHADFYYHDLQGIERAGTSKFAWYVHDFGTYLVLLEGDAHTIQIQQACLEAVRQNQGKGNMVPDNEALYVCNTLTGSMEQIHNFSEIQFTVLEGVA